MTKNILYGLIISLFFIGCKPPAKVTNKAIKMKDKTSLIKTTLENHKNHLPRYKTISGRANIDYDFKAAQNISGANTVSIRMLRDSIIWVSAPFGVIKLRLTPKKIEFYNRLNSTYLDATYDNLVNLVGINIKFKVLQNLLLGESAYDIEKTFETFEKLENLFSIKTTTKDHLKGIIYISTKSFDITKQSYLEPKSNNVFEVTYMHSENKIPKSLDLKFSQNNIFTHTLKIEYQNLRFNQKINFPYKIPDGFTKIEFLK